MAEDCGRLCAKLESLLGELGGSNGSDGSGKKEEREKIQKDKLLIGEVFVRSTVSLLFLSLDFSRLSRSEYQCDRLGVVPRDRQIAPL